MASRIITIFGANTNVGKTVVGAGLVQAACQQMDKVFFLKPLQTGTAIGDSDIDKVKSYNMNPKGELICEVLYSWQKPLSPHVAAAKSGNVPSDKAFNERVVNALKYAKADLSLIETAGGVLSPAASGTKQADLYSAINREVILVGDGRLGGISATLTSIEALQKRNFNILGLAIIEEDPEFGNYDYIKSSEKDLPVQQFTPLPKDGSAPLHEWFSINQDKFSKFLDVVLEEYANRSYETE